MAPPARADEVTVTVTRNTTAIPASGEAAPAAPSAAKTQAKSRSAKRVKKLSKAQRQRVRASKAVAVAKKQIGDPYRWGATGPGAFDCSGLVQFAWRKAGVKLPRTTWSQKSSVKKKISWKAMQPGDLVFTSGGGHVGIYVGHGKMIHSPNSGSRVRIDKLDTYRKRTFVGAVRPGI